MRVLRALLRRLTGDRPALLLCQFNGCWEDATTIVDGHLVCSLHAALIPAVDTAVQP